LEEGEERNIPSHSGPDSVIEPAPMVKAVRLWPLVWFG
jgi:hypothetical protein